MSGLKKEKGIFEKERIIVDFTKLGINNLSLLGRINYVKAHTPLETHWHKDTLEICYLSRGKQTYIVEEKDYNLYGGDVFITFPEEIHGSGNNPEDKSVLYYLLINLKKDSDNFLGYQKDEGKELLYALNNIKNRCFKGNPILKAILDKVFQTYFDGHQFKKIIICNLVTEFLIKVIELDKVKTTIISPEIKTILTFINSNIKEIITIDSLSKKANLSVSRFKQKFKIEVGIPPGEYILRQKIELAKEILKNTSSNITWIAYELSFSSSQYFSTVFKRFTGKRPKNYKQYQIL